MDIVSYSKAAKVEREVREARDSYMTLDNRMEALSIGNVASVKLKSELPTKGDNGRVYMVQKDIGNQNEPTLYTYDGLAYVKAGGDRLSNHTENGAIILNGTKTVVYTHPDTHDADMLTDGNIRVVMTREERIKLSNIEPSANHYIHPDIHSADMIVDGKDHVSMTREERSKLRSIDSWEVYSDLVDYADVFTYFAFDEQGRIIRQVVTDNYTEQSVREPVWTLPPSTDDYAENDSLMVIPVGEVYRFDGKAFVQLPGLLDVIYQYDTEGRMVAKSITAMGTTPMQTKFSYIYDSLGNRIAVKKYQG
ncbi:hypothetical protein HUB98_05260 [Paenibacillus barcinonensis]|uniref:Uncharacterized protein n=1 Tax=Paenibacillus barcinonensis TaxID=198119 RepID=A0A2V4VZX0_PAEBA|nr:hypothetical protein [Paenibacillus barcinonensis]PYE51395.1 hypothetical protein DFQ00_102189 [Paenibacillus barcinonensis]QKS55791.1 hypothetical protein HUB98_05260 [Paenibacillus barcinonensis]